jgi:archaellum component FlaG (FlaF/FlaG flagellin family)
MCNGRGILMPGAFHYNPATTKKGGAFQGPLSGLVYSASTAAPINPTPGDLWFNSDTAALLIYINDGTSSQWVETSSSGVTVNAINENLQTISTSKTLTASSNGISLGPITVNTSVTVTLGNGQRWIIL